MGIEEEEQKSPKYSCEGVGAAKTVLPFQIKTPTLCVTKLEIVNGEYDADLTPTQQQKEPRWWSSSCAAGEMEREMRRFPLTPNYFAQSLLASERGNKKSGSFTIGVLRQKKNRPPPLFLTPAHFTSRRGHKSGVLSPTVLSSHSSNVVPSCGERPAQQQQQQQQLSSFGRSCRAPLVSLSEDRCVLFAGPFSVSRLGCLTMQNVLLLNPENGQETNCRSLLSTGEIVSPLVLPEMTSANCDFVKNSSFTLFSTSVNTLYSPITYSQKAISLTRAESWQENGALCQEVNSTNQHQDQAICSTSSENAEVDSVFICSANNSLDAATMGSLLCADINIAQKSFSVLPSNAVSFEDVRIKSFIGEGASASVFSAEHVPTGKPLAVKRIDLSPLFSHWDFPAAGYTQCLQSATRVRQLELIVVRELQTLHVAYRSPFMAKVYNAFFSEHSMTLDIVMEYMHYGSLDRLLRLLRAAGKRQNNTNNHSEHTDSDGEVGDDVEVPERLVAVVGEQLLRGVDHMHKRGYIHRDIKPSNVLINDKGIVKLSDFGLSQWCNAPGGQQHVKTNSAPHHVANTTSRGEFTSFFAGNNCNYSDYVQCSGTSKYMSPERQRGKPHGKPSDIWAVGMTLAEFAVGEYPVDFGDSVDAFDRVYRMEAPLNLRRFRRLCPLSEEFLDFIRLCMLPLPEDRPTASELLEHSFFRQWETPFSVEEYLRQINGV